VEQIFYRSILFLTGIINLVMAGMLLVGSKPYKKYTVYYRTRLLTTLWIAAFGIGYIIHGVFLWRDTWPTAASALTATYFHLGAVCFNWGYVSLLNPNYLTRFVVYHDGLLFFFGVVGYWLVAILWKQAPILTMLSFGLYSREMSGRMTSTLPCRTSSLAIGVPNRKFEYSGIQRPTFAYK
jgi:hypothetical protein